jgi:GntR family transcriptional regulator
MASLLQLHVSPSSGVPIYRQIMNQVRAQIAGGNIGAAAFLPSVRQVAEQLQVNPMTVSKAYSLLEKDGVIEFVRGQGMRAKSLGASGNGKARQEVLVPLLKQVAVTSRQLSMSPSQVINQLKPMLEDRDE